MAKRLPPVNQCLNCGEAVTAAYCPQCGQEGVHHSATIWALLAELADGLFNLDSKLLRSLNALIFRPGMLTLAYNGGKRVRYHSPLRLYITGSIVFFLLVAWTQSRIDSQTAATRAKSPATAAAKSTDLTINGDILGKNRVAATSGKPGNYRLTMGDKSISSLDALPDNIEDFKKMMAPGQQLTPTNLYIINQVIKMKRLGQAAIVARFLSNIPNMMFFLLPIFAIALKCLYIRSNLHYVEHLVFLLHAHAFAYLVLASLMVLPSNKLLDLAILWIPIYVFLAMRAVYKQPIWKTAVKLGMLTVGYCTIFLVCLVGTIAFTFLTI